MRTPDYAGFIQSKGARVAPLGKRIGTEEVHPKLFDWQRRIVLWACAKGRAAVFADTGLGKTFIQLEWARLMGGDSLIVAPLSVARQTVREAKKIGLQVKYVRDAADVEPGISVTNYEVLEHFDPSRFRCVVLDESSILKNFSGKIRLRLTAMFRDTPYRLCCTATPAPNDQIEIGNHAEFLGVCKQSEMLSMFFVHDELTWRLKGHAHREYYRWLSSWSMSIRKPSDLGFDDDGYILPPLEITPVFVPSKYVPEGELFFSKLHGIQDRNRARRDGIQEKLSALQSILGTDPGQWIVWCGLNEESSSVAKATPDAVELQGSDSIETKVQTIEAFQDGGARILVTKPKIAGFGMNLQNCSNVVFFGINDSFEAYYQCIRRCYRFGQKRAVNVHVLLTDHEREVFENVLRKEVQAKLMGDELIGHVREFELEELGMAKTKQQTVESETVEGDGWTAMLGDSCQRLSEIGSEGIDLSVYSPPFADLFTYSPLAEDLGNSLGWDEFFQHYTFVIRELLRATKPGRMTAVHTADVPAMLSRNGYIGLRDFPGQVIQAYESNGWIYHGRVTIDKNPQAQAIRTKSKGLLFVQLEKDSIWSRPAVGDYILLFRKPGENVVPVRPVEHGEMTREMWIEWAHPVWYGINESDTLQRATAREDKDEKHVCPLQLGVIERCIKLYSNPGETILTPFGGIGSEAYTAVRLHRKAILIELKRSYFDAAISNLRVAERVREQGTLFAESVAS